MVIEVKYTGKEFIIEKESDFQKLKTRNFAEKEENEFKLNTIETLYLLENKKIEVFNKKSIKLSFEEIKKITKVNLQEYLVFKDLRKKGHIVKTALRYGFVFRVYEKGTKEHNSHSKWLVEIQNESSKINLRDIASKCRVAHTTKKNILIAVVDNDKTVTYFEINWKRII